MNYIWIKNGRVIDPATKRDAEGDVFIADGMKGEQLAPHGSLKKAGVVAITDDGLCIESNELMRRAVEYAKMFDLTVLDHCQDESMTKKAVMNEGVVSTRLGLQGWPNA